MKLLIFLLLLPAFLFSQTAKDERQLIALTINYDPDETENGYYLIADKPPCVQINLNQTFLLQSAWQKEGDSIVTIGAGTAKIINNKTVELSATLYPGKKIKKGDMAMFLVPLDRPVNDTLFFKMARLDINFKTIGDSIFYDRNAMLLSPAKYPANKILKDMAADIRYTGKEMIKINKELDRKITSGIYNGQMLFSMMQKVDGNDILKFLKYVYARPDKYKAHEWKISETFATWAISGTPEILIR